jgi:rSAM/selenodomain-associated transferase 1
MAKTTICIFAKPPRAGKAKTRLMPEIGPAAAASIANALLQDVIVAATQIRGAHVVLSATEAFQIEGAGALPVWLQPEGDLGRRLEQTLQRALSQSNFAVAVGADTPGLTASMLEEALESLRENEAVLGPAADGGYYLIGVRRCPNGLLRDIHWSQPTTLAQTIAQCRRFRINYSLARPWFDLDRASDLQHVCCLMRREALFAPHLKAALESMGMLCHSTAHEIFRNYPGVK